MKPLKSGDQTCIKLKSYLVNIIIPGVHGSLASRVIVLVADIARVVSSDCTDKDKRCSNPKRTVPALKQWR